MVEKIIVMSKEIRLAIYTISLYSIFMLWGYQQEKITFTSYSTNHNKDIKLKWNYPVALNLGMAFASWLTAIIVELVTGNNKKISYILFWKPALTAAIASPIGYEALKYINYPLMILTKSCKPVPVMTIGILFYRKTYKWYKYLSVALLCTGIAMFTSNKKSSDKANDSEIELTVTSIIFGMFLVLINLSLDGYTSNEQDHIFTKYSASSNQMMNYTNLWQCIYHIVYLGICYFIQSDGGEIVKAYHMLLECPALKYDIAMFCLCASIGQVLLFSVMQEFGSLVWITIGVTRKLFTIVLSVFIFNHAVSISQWLGVALVFIGLLLDIIMNYLNTENKNKSD